MNYVDLDELLLMAGHQIPARDMSAYDGKPFQCACGKTHSFNTSYMDFRNYGSTGVNAKMLVVCPDDPRYSTLIQTKYKFMVIFDRFESLAGHKS
ncbi:hypothetical protein [Thiomicrospira microaerophila]|uniref:hypothetical protein n=1 Tax=Thiomicrospira microaerophila TaxID=406020 RepID=UPI0005C939DF|nr:hypothetical protein [Thiomicrospira microaerophila]